MLVRPATGADLAGLLLLYEQLAEDRSASRPATGQTASRLMNAIRAQQGRTLLVAVIDGQIVGAADLAVLPNLTHGGDSWAIVENLIVDGTHRRKGVGRALMEEVIHRCDRAGCYKIQLLSRKHRHEAHIFYERLGFEALAEGFRRYRPAGR